jgi:hypothetical protein
MGLLESKTQTQSSSFANGKLIKDLILFYIQTKKKNMEIGSTRGIQRADW